jgi:hypothetical protein
MCQYDLIHNLRGTEFQNDSHSSFHRPTHAICFHRVGRPWDDWSFLPATWLSPIPQHAGKWWKGKFLEAKWSKSEDTCAKNCARKAYGGRWRNQTHFNLCIRWRRVVSYKLRKRGRGESWGRSGRDDGDAPCWEYKDSRQARDHHYKDWLVQSDGTEWTNK